MAPPLVCPQPLLVHDRSAISGPGRLHRRRYIGPAKEAADLIESSTSLCRAISAEAALAAVLQQLGR